MRRVSSAALLSFAVVTGLVATVTPRPVVPFIAVKQGITPYTFDGKRVFVVRSGSVVTAFAARSGRVRRAVRWCPREQVWWAPKDDLFAKSGAWAFGSVNHDMIRYPTTITADGLLKVDITKPIIPPRSDGKKEIYAPTFEFFQRYLNYTPDLPTRTRPVFCPNPIT